MNEKLFFLTGLQRVILFCSEGTKNKVQIQFGTGMTYAHVCKITAALIESEYATETKKGRMVMIDLTEKGKDKSKALLRYADESMRAFGRSKEGAIKDVRSDN